MHELANTQMHMPFSQSTPHVVVALPHSPQWDDRSTSSVIATTNRLLLLPSDKACWLAAYMCFTVLHQLNELNELSRLNQDKLGQLSRAAKGLLMLSSTVSTTSPTSLLFFCFISPILQVFCAMYPPKRIGFPAQLWGLLNGCYHVLPYSPHMWGSRRVSPPFNLTLTEIAIDVRLVPCIDFLTKLLFSTCKVSPRSE